ncbi:beta-galactosidase [Agromyces atrinae]|uniref:beta-galactosidase n=1 Tax=Agromyces atrinae TaxID=592376 RepID=UPI001F598C57|nr:beta-galactosidase [Agromyces atrinae]MCI2957659.1 beta-galactosidase [Agromyces atrinae]
MRDPAMRPLRVIHSAWATELTRPAMANEIDRHERIGLTNRYLERDGRPVVPVSGELHYSRVPRSEWRERLHLMRSGGVTVVATYVLWIHHEPTRGSISFDDGLDLAAFVDLCAELGLDVVVRLGPWCHGEVRNGGFPDWVSALPVQHRTDDPAYLAVVTEWFTRLAAELAPLCGPTSPIIGVQIENELYDQPTHISTLKSLVRGLGITAPLYTATAWGGADLPEGDVLPLFGGYADGFWVDAAEPWDDTFREHFLFSHVWDDPGIGADLRTDVPVEPPRLPSALFPAATCEIGGGMATAYHRRPVIDGRAIGAVGLAKIGNGSAWQGFYMYAGGTNPVDDVQESQATGYPNDLPRFDYDFHAPIGAAGELAPAHAVLRRQHAFLAAFGDRLATMPSSLPEERPANAYDSTTLRWALRSDGATGFVFISWTQPYEPLTDAPGVRFALELDAETVEFPAQTITIPEGTLAHWPVGLELDGVTLRWATASALTVLTGREHLTLVLAAESRIDVEVAFGDGHLLDGVPAAGSQRLAAGTHRVTSASGAAIDLLVLSAEDSDRAWVLGGRERVLVLSDEPVWIESSTAATGDVLAARSAATPDVRRYGTETRSFESVVFAPSTSGDAGVGSTAVVVTPLREPAEVPATYGEFNGRASSPSSAAIVELAAAWSLDVVGDAADDSRRTLTIEWAGDVAVLEVDGAVVADRFWDGTPWTVDIDALGISESSTAIIRIVPLHSAAAIRLAADAEARRAENVGPLVALDRVQVTRTGVWRS